ncbi:MAG: N-acetylmuramoyl-L-alanine amidase [Pseudomonadota bacterium]
MKLNYKILQYFIKICLDKTAKMWLSRPSGLCIFFIVLFFLQLVFCTNYLLATDKIFIDNVQQLNLSGVKALNFAMNKPPRYDISRLGNIVLLTLYETEWQISKDITTTSPVRSIKPVPQHDGRLVIELMLGDNNFYEVFAELNKAVSGKNYELVLKFASPSTKPKSKSIASKDVRVKNTNKQTYAKTKNHPKSANTSTVIVLDPGHGGRDPGAISSYHKISEKKVTLSYAKDLKQYLERKGYKVIMTRYNDRYLSLRQRVKIAQKHNAQLFISMHADSHTNKKAKGLSVYTLSDRPSDKEAAWLASHHDLSDTVKDVKTDYDASVDRMLVGMMQRDNRNTSAELANLLVKQLSTKVQLVQNTHRFARFQVLKQLSSPAVLLELGYLSNKKEAKLLATSSYRHKLVTAIGEAIHSHLQQRKL